VEDERDRPLDERDLDEDPVAQLQGWLAEARAAGITLPEAMTVATATRDGAPSARMVLLKAVDDSGLSFFTSYASRKGFELAENPRAAVVLYWHLLGRQVRVEGDVERLSAAESDEYFHSRPPGSRRSAAASPQSEVIATRAELEDAAAALSDDVSRPEDWGGYLLVPTRWEFWQIGRAHV